MKDWEVKDVLLKMDTMGKTKTIVKILASDIQIITVKNLFFSLISVGVAYNVLSWDKIQRGNLKCRNKC